MSDEKLPGVSNEHRAARDEIIGFLMLKNWPNYYKVSVAEIIAHHFPSDVDLTVERDRLRAFAEERERLRAFAEKVARGAYRVSSEIRGLPISEQCDAELIAAAKEALGAKP